VLVRFERDALLAIFLVADEKYFYRFLATSGHLEFLLFDGSGQRDADYRKPATRIGSGNQHGLV